MYKLSYERCVCLVFLVMVVLLSCSGFRIDRLPPMTDLSKRNGAKPDASHSDLLNRLTPTKMRHSRRTQRNHHQQQQHNLDAVADAQPPRQRNRAPCQEQDVARKAYTADTVVLAKAESMSSNRVRNYLVSFRVLRRYKTSRYPVDDNIRLTFLNDSRRMNCESEIGGRNGVVKAQIQQSKEYYLFLNSRGNHDYAVLGMPVLKRRRNQERVEKIIRNVTGKNYEPKLKNMTLNASATRLEPGEDKLRLVCRVKGQPIPVITWRKNDSNLHSNSSIKITYSNKGRKSTLVIRKPQEADSGRYYCVATSVTKQELTSHKDILISNSNGEECKMPYRNTFCQNGGTCMEIPQIRELSCVCPDGFTGRQCEKKEVSLNIGISQTTEPYQALQEDLTRNN